MFTICWWGYHWDVVLKSSRAANSELPCAEAPSRTGISSLIPMYWQYILYITSFQSPPIYLKGWCVVLSGMLFWSPQAASTMIWVTVAFLSTHLHYSHYSLYLNHEATSPHTWAMKHFRIVNLCASECCSVYEHVPPVNNQCILHWCWFPSIYIRCVLLKSSFTYTAPISIVYVQLHRY